MGDIRRPPRLFLVKGTKGQRINLYDQNMNSVVARWLGRLLTSLRWCLCANRTNPVGMAV